MGHGTGAHTARGATITLWLAGISVAGISCRSEDVAGVNGSDARVASLSSSPVAVAASPLSFRQLDAGKGAHTCGVTTGDKAYCWGIGIFGELGDGTFMPRSRPVAVAGALAFRTVSGGNAHTCG